MPDYAHHEQLRLENFTAFREVEFQFVPGINVFVGENGTGKTHVMKSLYALQLRMFHSIPVSPETWEDTFQVDNLRQLSRLQSKEKYSKLSGKYSGLSWMVYIDQFSQDDSILDDEKLKGIERPVFVPAIDMMGHTKGFLAAMNQVVLDFDLTCCDIVSLLGLQKRNGKKYEALIETLQTLIGGKLEYNEVTGRFFLRTDHGTMPMPLVAEGLRKIATLLRLVQNGWLVPGTTLFWDEPEVNLNPSLMDEVVGALWVLARSGVQIFVATHSYVLLRELEVQARKSDSLCFFAFAHTEDGVTVQPARTYLEITPNLIEEQYASLYDRGIAKRLGGND